MSFRGCFVCFLLLGRINHEDAGTQRCTKERVVLTDYTDCHRHMQGLLMLKSSVRICAFCEQP